MRQFLRLRYNNIIQGDRAILNNSKTNCVLDNFSRPSLQIFSLEHIGLYFFVFIFGPSHKKVFISVANPSLDSIDLISLWDFSHISIDIRCVRAYFIFSQAPSTNQLQVDNLGEILLLLLFASEQLNRIPKKAALHSDHRRYTCISSSQLSCNQTLH